MALFAIVYLLVKLNYTHARYKQELQTGGQHKEAIKDAQILIKKYRTQLQRSIGNIDILTEELNKVRNDIKTLRAKNSQTRLEKGQLSQKVKE